MTEPLTIVDGHTRLVVDTDPATHRLRVTMEEYDPEDSYDGERFWGPLGCVSMDRERAAELATAADQSLIACRAAADTLQARLDVAEQDRDKARDERDTSRAINEGRLR